MNYRDKIRKAIECPQFGSITYGEWGMLNFDQRKSIKRLLDELDSADNYIVKMLGDLHKLQKENKILKENAEHNDKVVDKVNWENQLLKKENQQLKEQQKEFIEWLEKESKEVIRDAGYHQRICEDILEKYKEIVGSDK